MSARPSRWRRLPRAGLLLLVGVAAAAPLLAQRVPLLVFEDAALRLPFLRVLTGAEMLVSGAGLLAMIGFATRRWPATRWRVALLGIGLLALSFAAARQRPVNAAALDLGARDPARAFVLHAPLGAGPQRHDPRARLLPPFREAARPLGTDRFGRCVASRLVHGARTSLVVATLATGLALLLAGAIATLCALGGRRADAPLTLLILVMASFPGLLLLLALQGLMPSRLLGTSLALGALLWPLPARVFRAELLRLRALPFVEAARSLGISPLRRWRHHLLPHALPQVAVQAAFLFAGVILLEGTLSFLGLGVGAQEPSWGQLIAQGRAARLDAPHLVALPAGLILLTLVSAHAHAEHLRTRAGRLDR